MSRFAVASAAVLAFSSPVFAGSYTEEVVDKYLEQVSQFGLNIAVSDRKSAGDTVELQGVELSDDMGQLQVDVPWMKARATGPEKVAVTFAPVVTITATSMGEDQEPIVLEMSSSGMDYVISGQLDALNSNYTAETVKIVQTSGTFVNGLNITLSDVVSSQISETADTQKITGDMSAGSIKYGYEIVQDGTRIATTGEFAGVETGSVTEILTKDKDKSFLTGDHNIQFSFSANRADNTTTSGPEGQAYTVALSAENWRADGTFIDGVISYSASSANNNYDFDIASTGLAPFSVKLPLMTAKLTLPLRENETASEMVLGLEMKGMEASDTLWALIDPTAGLPRTPANLSFDVAAMMKWKVDPTDPAQMTDLEKTEKPVEIENVELRDLKLDIAGVSFVGQGALDIDNSTFPPIPVGVFDLDLRGGIGLLDKLAELGLVPGPQVGMIKGMSGMFAVPASDGADHLISKIEFLKDRSVLANGVRVK